MIILILLGVLMIVLLIRILLYILEERNKCKHIWEETHRSKWNSDLYGDFTKVELKCKKCGDVESRRI